MCEGIDIEEKTTDFPLAMDPPRESVVELTRGLMGRALEQSRRSPRKRIIMPFHKSTQSTLHRMFNVCQPGTYIRPHWHRTPPKDEALVLLQGAIAVFLFDDEGKTMDIIRLKADSDSFGVDLPAGSCHCLVVLEEDTVVYEVKPGPYKATTDKDFAPWAPEEGSPEAAGYLADLLRQLEV